MASYRILYNESTPDLTSRSTILPGASVARQRLGRLTEYRVSAVEQRMEFRGLP